MNFPLAPWMLAAALLSAACSGAAPDQEELGNAEDSLCICPSGQHCEQGACVHDFAWWGMNSSPYPVENGCTAYSPDTILDVQNAQTAGSPQPTGEYGQARTDCKNAWILDLKNTSNRDLEFRAQASVYTPTIPTSICNDQKGYVQLFGYHPATAKWYYLDTQWLKMHVECLGGVMGVCTRDECQQDEDASTYRIQDSPFSTIRAVVRRWDSHQTQNGYLRIVSQ